MHKSVLLQEAIDGLDLSSGKTVIDGTLGAGGHTSEIAKRFKSAVKIHAFDLDADAIERSKEKISNFESDVHFHLENFKNMNEVLGGEKVDAILLDLGFSSDQLESSGRGISFKKDEPLIMTLKKDLSESDFSARDLVNTWAEEDIANVLYGFGEERFARRIAREIVETRENHPIETTHDLVNVVLSAVPAFYRIGRINPATKTFQAIRIAVNGELDSLKTALVEGFEALKPGGRFAIITFHSLEDRIVKNFFRDKDKEGVAEILNKKPITPADEELKENPRSRSAKLRIIKKI